MSPAPGPDPDLMEYVSRMNPDSWKCTECGAGQPGLTVLVPKVGAVSFREGAVAGEIVPNIPMLCPVCLPKRRPR